jgi:hypothetical protein
MFNVTAENSTSFVHKIKRIAMQIGETYISLVWVCVCTAARSILSLGYRRLSVTVFSSQK